MPDDNVIQFPHQSSDVGSKVVAYFTGVNMTFDGACDGLVHYFDTVPEKCKCGKEQWDGGPIKTDA